MRTVASSRYLKTSQPDDAAEYLAKLQCLAAKNPDEIRSYNLKFNEGEPSDNVIKLRSLMKKHKDYKSTQPGSQNIMEEDSPYF